MDPTVVDALVAWLRGRPDCRLEDGLDERELTRAEADTAISFPPLWRAVLARAHPVATARVAYPDWRLRDDSAARLMANPGAGVLFDVEHNGFWWPAWGPRPDRLGDALTTATRQLDAVPRLVPIRGHWYTGSQDGAPVLSIVQTDVHEQAGTVAGLAPGRGPQAQAINAIPFWSELRL